VPRFPQRCATRDQLLLLSATMSQIGDFTLGFTALPHANPLSLFRIAKSGLGVNFGGRWLPSFVKTQPVVTNMPPQTAAHPRADGIKAEKAVDRRGIVDRLGLGSAPNS